MMFILRGIERVFIDTDNRSRGERWEHEPEPASLLNFKALRQLSRALFCIVPVEDHAVFRSCDGGRFPVAGVYGGRVGDEGGDLLDSRPHSRR